MKRIASIVFMVLLASHADAAITDVSSAAEFSAAVNTAAPGDVLRLAPGHYGAAVIDGKSFSTPVTIKALDPQNPPSFSSFRILNGNGLTVEDITVEYGATNAPLTTYAFEVRGSDNVALRRLEVMSAPDGIRTNDAYGVFLRDGSMVTIEDSFIHDVFRGIALFEITDGAAERNLITQAGSDGIVGRGLINVKIQSNIIKDFDVIDPVAHHPDGIQIWARDAERQTVGVEISQNVILRGKGDPTQGILIGTDELPADDITITNNVIHQSMYQGIYVERVGNVDVSNNTVTPFNWKTDEPGIEIRSPTGPATVGDNIAVKYRLASAVNATGNVEIDFGNPWLETYAETLMQAPHEGEAARPEDFRRKTDIGAVGFIEALASNSPAVLQIAHTRLAATPLNEVDLSVEPAVNAGWRLTSPGDLGETNATGSTATATFDGAGLGKVVTTATIDGAQETTDKSILVHDPVIIDWTFDSGVTEAAANPIPFTGDAAGFSKEAGNWFATFNGLKPKDGGKIFTSDISAKASSANDLLIETRVRRQPSNGWQILAVVPSAYEARFSGNHVRLSVWNADGIVKRVTAYNAGIADGNWHDIKLQYTAESGLIEIIVDSVIKAQGAGPGGRIAYQPNQRLYVGGSPWIASFKGDVEYLKIAR